MYKFFNDNRGTVTLLLSIILIPILSLSSLMVEIGRAVSAKQALKEAENSSILSLLADFEDVLYEQYGILGTYVDNEDEKNQKFEEYIKYNSDNIGDKANSFSSMYNITDSSVKGVYNLAEIDVLKRSILEGGKYSAVYDIADEYLDLEALIQKLTDELVNGLGINDILSKFTSALDKIAKVADMISKVKKVKDKVDDINGKISSMKTTIEDLNNKLNEKKTILDKYGGKEPSAPSSNNLDKANALVNILSACNNVDKNTEFSQSQMPPNLSNDAKTLNLQLAETRYENGKSVQYTYTMQEFFIKNSLPLGVSPSNIKGYDDINSALKSAERVKSDYQKQYNSDYSKYESDVKDLNTVNSKIKSFLPQAATKASDLANAISSYGTAIQDAISAIADVRGITIDFDNDGSNDTQVSENVNNAMSELENQASNVASTVADVFTNISNAFTALSNTGSTDIEAIRNAIGNKIAGFSWSNIETTIKNYIFSNVLSKDRISEIVKQLDDANNWFSDLKNLISIIDTMLDVLKPWPDTNNSDLNVVMSPANMGITLSPSSGQSNPFLLSDASFINNKIQVGNKIVSGINGVKPLIGLSATNVTTPGENERGLIDTLISVAESFSNLLQNFKGMFVDNDGKLKSISSMVSSFKDVKDSAKQLITDIGDLFSGLGSLLTAALNSAYTNVMLTNYAETHFLNRLSTTSNPQDNIYQLFKQCEEEYIIAGKSDEKTNQTRIAMAIFMYRIVVNIVAVVKDANAMKAISACNVFAPLVFILWVYYESCIDINLIMYDCSLDLFKSDLWLSVNSLESLANNVKNINKADEPKKIVQTLFNASDDNSGFKYKNYLTFMMLFVSNNKKTQRIGDLIQWHVRTSNHNFLLKNTYTMFRVDVSATLNPMLPIINLSGNSSGGLTNATKIEQVWYEGY